MINILNGKHQTGCYAFVDGISRFEKELGKILRDATELSRKDSTSCENLPDCVYANDHEFLPYCASYDN